MQVFTFDLNRQEDELNMALEDYAQDVKDLHFIEDKAIIVLKDDFDMGEYVMQQIKEASDALVKKEYELMLLNSYKHIDKEKITGAIEQAETEIKTLKAKIKTSNEWLKTQSKK
jgi:hypothetical protein